MKFPRGSGILLHPTSLPGDFGIGDLGPKAYQFVDLLAEAKQSYWQILPLGPTGYGDSPYQCFSAFAGNTLLLSPERLVDEGLIDETVLSENPDARTERVDFGAVYEWKKELLSKAHISFVRDAKADLRSNFASFARENDWWLNDYAIYRALKSANDQKPWYEWEAELKLRNAERLKRESDRLGEHIEAEKFCQFLFYSQWAALKNYANEKGVTIIGDIPYYVALDSADVWCNQDKFKLNADGSPRVVAGVPPDYFSKTGQLWGNPIYDWDAMRRDGFHWWIARMAFTLRMVDVIRIDHFRGFASAWEVPGGDETAEDGLWVDVPGRELFLAVQDALGRLPLIAEDLGVITPDVTELRDGFGFPGMRILQYAFGGDANNRDLPHNYIPNCIAYTGTHDNDTIVGWWQAGTGDDPTTDSNTGSRVQEHCRKYLDTDGSEIHWDLIRAAWASVAEIAISPMQDVLGLGTEARMNLPASDSGNWSWRLRDGAITPKIVERLRELTGLYGRAS